MSLSNNLFRRAFRSADFEYGLNSVTVHAQVPSISSMYGCGRRFPSCLLTRTTLTDSSVQTCNVSACAVCTNDFGSAIQACAQCSSNAVHASSSELHNLQDSLNSTCPPISVEVIDHKHLVYSITPYRCLYDDHVNDDSDRANMYCRREADQQPHAEYKCHKRCDEPLRKLQLEYHLGNTCRDHLPCNQRQSLILLRSYTVCRSHQY